MTAGLCLSLRLFASAIGYYDDVIRTVLRQRLPDVVAGDDLPDGLVASELDTPIGTAALVVLVLVIAVKIVSHLTRLVAKVAVTVAAMALLGGGLGAVTGLFG